MQYRMPRPGLLEPLEVSMLHSGTPKKGEPKLESQFAVAEPAIGSMKISELNVASLFQKLEALSGQLHGLRDGQSQLQLKIDYVHRGLCSITEVVGGSPICAPGCNCASCAAMLTSWQHAEASAMHATERNAEDHDGMDVTTPLKASNIGRKDPGETPHWGDGDLAASGSRDVPDEAVLCEFDTISKMVACPLEPKMLEEETPKAHETDTAHCSCQSEMIEQELKHILLTNSAVHHKASRRSQLVTARLGHSLASWQRLSNFMEKMHGREWEMTFDCAIGLIIVLNAIFIGISMDASDQRAASLLIVEAIFGIIFWFELIVKLRIHGWRDQYSGKDACLNIFDTSLVVADTFQFMMQIFFREQSAELSSQGISASLFRIVRLVRLARILRILQLAVFKDLLTMIQGMMGGMPTLFWSMILFLISIYVVALVCREALGPNPTREFNEHIQLYFATVPRSMFTMFRCSFGDCSTAAGTPLFEHVTEEHGGFWSLLYTCFVFVVVIGLFNVISAIFVENTLASASELAAKKRRKLLEDPERWATSVCQLLQSLLDEMDDDQISYPHLFRLEDENCTQDLLREVLQTEFPGEHVKRVVCEHEQARRALDRLDIDPNDHAYLADILDPQNDGAITVQELVDGLKRLRGEPRRSDIITIDLMVRSLQGRIDEIWKWSNPAMKERPEWSR